MLNFVDCLMIFYWIIPFGNSMIHYSDQMLVISFFRLALSPQPFSIMFSLLCLCCFLLVMEAYSNYCFYSNLLHLLCSFPPIFHPNSQGLSAPHHNHLLEKNPSEVNHQIYSILKILHSFSHSHSFY